MERQEQPRRGEEISMILGLLCLQKVLKRMICSCYIIRNGNTGGREPARVSRKVLEAWIKYIKTEKGD